MKAISFPNLKIEATLDEITQRQLETYQTMLSTESENLKSPAVFNSLIIRAAHAAGFLHGIDVSAVPEMKPSTLAAISKAIYAFVLEQQAPPPLA